MDRPWRKPRIDGSNRCNHNSWICNGMHLINYFFPLEKKEVDFSQQILHLGRSFLPRCVISYNSPSKFHSQLIKCKQTSFLQAWYIGAFCSFVDNWENRLCQGCRMAYFQTKKIPLWINFEGPWNWKGLCILRLFGICNGHLEHFMAIW
jgi:hypothetical protein